MPGPNSILESLSPEAREKVIGWLELHSTREVVEKIAQPPPEGFGIQTHVTTLRRFYARHRAENRDGDFELARLLSSPEAAHPVENATESLVSDWAFQIAASPRRNLSAFKALSRWMLKQREEKQRDREINVLLDRLALDREKFQFNVSRQALFHYVEIEKIAHNSTLDNEDKINAVRSVLFNIPIDQLPK